MHYHYSRLPDTNLSLPKITMYPKFNPRTLQLPVIEIIDEVKRQLARKNTLIVTAPPGAGKSTVLPLALLGEPWLISKKIIVLEPRRLAASSIAHRMADLLGEPVGNTVGYRIRFENKVSKNTRIEVVTEGILTRMLQSDNALENVGLIVFDEFHERSIHADIALALSRDVQEVLRSDLRILIMSATLDVSQLGELLNAAIVESEGKMYAVELIYTGEQDIINLADLCGRTVVKAVKEREGDCLVFLPGQAEIRKCSEMLSKTLSGFAIYNLYGQLSHMEQKAALLRDVGGRRKIVLATSIAETSLTIEGIKIVVDSGFTRKQTFDPLTGLSALKTVQVSVDSADQRAGRAGRLSEGTCYRMWSAATQQRLAPYRAPEILETDLTPLLLELLEWGVTDTASLFWLNVPPASALIAAKGLLASLGAVENDKITVRGKKMHRLPLHPRLANMLIQAEELGKLSLATDLAALLEERDPFDRALVGADINLRIEHLRRYRSEQRPDRNWEKIEKTAGAYRTLFHIAPDNSTVGSYDTGLLLAYAYPERIASVKDARKGLFLLANGRSAAISREDGLAHEAWLAVAELDAQRGQGKIFSAAPVNPQDIIHLAKEMENIRWDTRKRELLATTDLCIGSIVLRSKPLAYLDSRKLEDVISVTIKTEGKNLLDFSEEVTAWQNRVLSLKIWNPGQHWPDVSTDALLERNIPWLGPYFEQLRKAEDFKRINLLLVLKNSLNYEQQIQLNTLAPETIPVPSSSNIKLNYSRYGQEPVLAVRLQELFGMVSTPKVNAGTKNVVIHLLSPGYKPVQVTSDLRSFWENTYFEVRKELKRRYPKHSWPENPLEAEPVRGVKRR